MTCNCVLLLMILVLATALSPIQASPKGTRSTYIRRQLDHCCNKKSKKDESDAANPPVISPPAPDIKPPVPSPMVFPTASPTIRPTVAPMEPDTSVNPPSLTADADNLSDTSTEALDTSSEASPECEALKNGIVYRTDASTTVQYSLEIITRAGIDVKRAYSSVGENLQKYLEDFLIECDQRIRQLHSEESTGVNIQGIDINNSPSTLKKTECQAGLSVSPPAICFSAEDSITIYLDEESTADTDKDAAIAQVLHALDDLPEDYIAKGNAGILGVKLLITERLQTESGTKAVDGATLATDTGNGKSTSSGISPAGTVFIVISCMTVLIVAVVVGRRRLENGNPFRHTKYVDEFSLDESFNPETPVQMIEKEVYNFDAIKIDKPNTKKMMIDDDGNEVEVVIQGNIKEGDTWSVSDTDSQSRSNLSTVSLDDSLEEDNVERPASVMSSMMCFSTKRQYHIKDSVDF